MKNFENIFWFTLIAVGIWGALTPGRQFKFLPEKPYSFNIPPIVSVLIFVFIAYMLFTSK